MSIYRIALCNVLHGALYLLVNQFELPIDSKWHIRYNDNINKFII